MEELVEQAKQGNKEAFTTLILQNKMSLYKIARARLNKEEDIEDAIQETMLQAYLQLQKLKDNTKFYYWTIQILINKCKEMYRKKKASFISFEEVEGSLETTFDKNMEDKILYDNILSRLKYEERILLLLYYNDGYTTKQIAEILGKKENTIKSMLKRIRDKLKKDFKEGECANG